MFWLRNKKKNPLDTHMWGPEIKISHAPADPQDGDIFWPRCHYFNKLKQGCPDDTTFQLQMLFVILLHTRSFLIFPLLDLRITCDPRVGSFF